MKHAFETRKIAATQQWFDSPRFAGIIRLYTARQVVEQRGTIATDYAVAREAASGVPRPPAPALRGAQVHHHVRPVLARAGRGDEARWGSRGSTSAAGRRPPRAARARTRDPIWPATRSARCPTRRRRSCAPCSRRIATSSITRSRMTEAQRAATPAVDYRPFIIADADTGHGGDAHVRNLIRRFVEAGVPGYHIEDQRPGTKKCGHQGGKVLVAEDEQIKRLNAARFQLDVMGVPGIIVARTDAEAANLLDGRGDERDQPFMLGATNLDVPTYKPCFLALIQHFHEPGVDELNGHLLYAVPAGEHAAARTWLERHGILAQATEAVAVVAGRQRVRRSTRCSTRSPPVPRRLGGRGRAEDLRRGGCRRDRVPGQRRRTVRDERRRVAALRRARLALRRPREGARTRHRRRLGLRGRQDARGLLPGARRHPVRHRQVAGGRAVRRPALDGDQDRRPRTTRASSPRRSTRSSPTRCSPTTCRPRSAGTRPA